MIQHVNIPPAGITLADPLLEQQQEVVVRHYHISKKEVTMVTRLELTNQPEKQLTEI